MNENFADVRNMLANLAMEELWNETRKLIDKCGGFEGAEIYLRAQYQAVSNLRSLAEKEDDEIGDEL